MPRIASVGGLLASLLLVVIGIAAVVVGASGHSQVRDEIKQENIVGTPDMSPDAIEVTQGQEVPDCTIAEQPVETGDDAQCFADYLRIHALESTGGKTYAELPRFIDNQGKPTEDEAAAAIDPETGEAKENALREVWVSGTAFSTALNTSFFAEQVALFSMVMGIALILIGIGFGVLIWFGGLRPAREQAGA